VCTGSLLVFHKWKFVGCVFGGHCQAQCALAASGFFISGSLLDVYLVDVFRHSVPDNVHKLHFQKSSTYEKPEAASAVLGS
jgi:hypothetical protein